MKVAVVIWEDRHKGPVPYVFADTAVAIEWARARALEHVCAEPAEFEEFSEPGDDVVYEVTYCVEGDSLSVTECEIQ